MDATYISANSFTVAGDRTSEFVSDRRLKLECGVDGTKYTTVISSSYSSPNTTVTIDESILTSNLTVVLYGIVQPGEYGSLPDHSHDGSGGSGGELTVFSGTSMHVDGDATVTGTMYAHVYDSYSPLTIKDGGVTVMLGDGAGNVNFPSGAFVNGSSIVSDSLLATTSGTLQSQIDGKSDIGHTHTESNITNLDKYTQVEVDTISGTLQTNIDAKPDTLLELTDTPSAYDDGMYLRSTASGIEWATASGGYLELDGGTPMSGDLDMGGHVITTVSGIILKASDNSEWLLSVTVSGALYTTAI